MFKGLMGLGEDPERRGLIETMLILALADGELEEDEISDIIANSLRHPKMKGMNDREFDRLIRRSLTAIDKQGLDKRIESVCALLPSKQSRLDALDLAISVAMSDGELEAPEERVMERMAHLMGLTQAEVQSIVQRYLS